MTDTTGSEPQTPKPQPDETPTTANATAARIPEGRYGAERGGMSTRGKVGLGGTGLLILLGVVGYIGWRQSNPQITATVLHYTTGTSNVQVTFEVDKPAAKTVSCTVDATDTRGTVVGSVAVQVPAGRDKNIMSYELSTTSAPATVIVQSCTATS